VERGDILHPRRILHLPPLQLAAVGAVSEIELQLFPGGFVLSCHDFNLFSFIQ
jgi:hypothetical protein